MSAPTIPPPPEPTTANYVLRGLVIAGALLFGLLGALAGSAVDDISSSSGEGGVTGVQLIGVGETVDDAPMGSFASETEAPIAVAETGEQNPMDGMDGDDPLETGGFYFGSEGIAECDRDQFLFGLSTNSDLLAALAGSAGVNGSRIAQWVNRLTPGYLPGDTRVTRSGWNGSQLTTNQAVLQSGTAVLVDTSGAPVVMCNGGSLLGDPDDWNDPAFAGTEWDDFDAGDLLTIQVGDEEALFMVCIDPETGERFIRLIGVIEPPPPPGDKNLEITLTWEGSDDDLDLHVTEPSGTTLNFTNQTTVSPDGGALSPDVIPAGDTGFHRERIFYPDAPPGTFDIDVRNYSTGSTSEEQVCFELIAKVNGVDVPGSPQSGCPASDNANGGPDGFGRSIAGITLTCDETGGELTTNSISTPTTTLAPPTTVAGPPTTISGPPTTVSDVEGKRVEVRLSWEGSDDDLDLSVAGPGNQSHSGDVIPGPGDTGLHQETITLNNAPDGSWTIDVNHFGSGGSREERVCFQVEILINGSPVPGSPQGDCGPSGDGPQGNLYSIPLTCQNGVGRLG